MNNQDALTTIDRLLEGLAHARRYPQMYVQPVTPANLITFLGGLRTGLQFAGLWWRPEHRAGALQARELEQSVAKWEDDDLAARGLPPAAVIDELLAIEIEMWQAHRTKLAQGS